MSLGAKCKSEKLINQLIKLFTNMAQRLKKNLNLYCYMMYSYYYHFFFILNQTSTD